LDRSGPFLLASLIALLKVGSTRPTRHGVLTSHSLSHRASGEQLCVPRQRQIVAGRPARVRFARDDYQCVEGVTLLHCKLQIAD